MSSDNELSGRAHSFTCNHCRRGFDCINEIHRHISICEFRPFTSRCPDCNSPDYDRKECRGCGYKVCATCEFKAMDGLNHCPTCLGKAEAKAFKEAEAKVFNSYLMEQFNPKDIIGSNKIPLHLWPETATVLGSLALLDGALKYGRSNWRAVGIRASIYYDAARRHLNAWFEGEDVDQDSGLPHLAHALACIAIIVDAQNAGKITDDRNLPGNYIGQVLGLTHHVARLKELHKDKDPRHFTIKDKDNNNQ